MSTLTTPVPDRAIFPTGPVFRLTVENYHEMIAAGILTTDDRVELLEGALICKMGQNPAHRTAVIKLQRALIPLLPASVFPQFQAPITLTGSEPEPDGAVVLGTIGAFNDRNPPGGVVCLVVEVSDRTLRQDRGIKRRVYAEAGIPVYWIVNLIDRTIEVYTEPTASAYNTTIVYTPGQQIPVIVSGQSVGEIAVDDLLP